MLAPADDRLLRAPLDVHPGDFFFNAHAELLAHPKASCTAIVLFALLCIGRALLPARARPHLRTAIALLGFYVLTIVARTELITNTADPETYHWVALVGLLALYFGLIATCALLLFDVLGRRFGVPRIIRDVTTAVASGIFFFALLARSGVNVLQLVTTSAVITAVIGLSLQDTLGNIISGIALQLDSAFNIGDWVRVDDKVTGRVREIKWRSTLIETRDGDQVVFPNTLVNRAQVIRFQHGTLQHRQWVYFHASLRHPPNAVIEAVLSALVGTPNVSTDIPPDCVVWDFDDAGTRYAVRYRIVDILPDDKTNSEVRKRIWYALHRAELELTYPHRTVEMTELGADAKERAREKDLARRLRWLAKIPLLQPLDEDERKTLAAGLRFLQFARDEVIIHQGREGDSLFIVLKGTVVVKFDIEGVQHEMRRLGAGDFFGEMSLLTGAPRRATIVACEDTECYVIDRALMETVLTQNPKLAEQIGALLAARESELALEQAKVHTQVAPDEGAILHRIRTFFGLA